jgi:type II secretory ATPase GspE/PulE/Tfp pilus assembly ATPase PilB-like protein
MELTKRKSLGQILIGVGMIAEAELEEALELQKTTGKRLGETLEDMGVCTRDDVEWAISHQFDIPIVRINKNLLDQEAIDAIPAGVARAFRLFPTLIVGDEINVVMADPTDTKALEKVASITGLSVNIAIGMPSEIDELIREYYDAKIDEKGKDLGDGITSELFTPEELSEVLADSTTETFINKLLEKAMLEQAEAICLRSEDEINLVEFRQGGIFRKMIELSAPWYRQTIWKFLKIIEFVESDRLSVRTGNLVAELENRAVRFETNYYTGMSGEMLVLTPTLVGESAVVELAMQDEEAKNFEKFMPHAHGVFVCGHHRELGRLLSRLLEETKFPEKVVLAGRKDADLPYWPGKPLTLDGMEEDLSLAEIFTKISGFGRHIYFLENKAEENPVEAGFRAALEGRLLFVPYPGGEAIDILTSLMGGVKSLDMLTFGLAGTIVFKQVKVLCDECKTEQVPAPELLRLLRLRPQEGQKFYKPGKCESCGNSGYSGSSYIIEIVLFDAEFKKKFLESGGDVRQTLSDRGVKTLRDRATEMVLSGQVALKDIL